MDKILGIGNALVDVMTLIDNDNILEIFSLPKGSMQLVDGEKSTLIKAETISFKRNLASGGSVANTMHGLAMLGAKSGFIGSVGNDEMGDFFENDMKSAGVNTFLSRRDNVTGTAVALISQDSERTFATHLGAAVELVSSDLNPENFKGYNILYVEGYLIFNKELVERACAIAKENNMKIALDLSSYNVVDAKLNDFKEIVEKYVDIIFANEEESKSFTGLEPTDAIEILSALCETAVVKVGREGSLIKRGAELIRIGTIPVNCVDTTGAGDLYASGFLYGYANGLSLEKCGLFGSILAGHVIEIVGARMDEHRWRKIMSLLKDQAMAMEE
jgi:sugar/nucleoside kinase (ribokinase family)